MAIRNLTYWNDPLFRKKSKTIKKFDERLWILLDDMRDTLAKVKGYGCAAVHVGVLRRAIVIFDRNNIIELINPVVIKVSDEIQEVTEGSIAPGAPRGIVIRPKKVTVEGFDRNGEPVTVIGTDILAAALLHEIDHLDGIKFTDKVRKASHE